MNRIICVVASCLAVATATADTHYIVTYKERPIGLASIVLKKLADGRIYRRYVFKHAYKGVPSTEDFQFWYTHDGRPTKEVYVGTAKTQHVSATITFQDGLANEAWNVNGWTKTVRAQAPKDGNFVQPAASWFVTMKPKKGVQVYFWSFSMTRGKWERDWALYVGDVGKNHKFIECKTLSTNTIICDSSGLPVTTVGNDGVGLKRR